MAASSEEEMCARVPIIVVLGATGSGKSKLGIEIARKFGGEVLSADSMQLYMGGEVWVMTEDIKLQLERWEREILKKIYGPIKDKDGWKIRTNNEINQLYKRPT
ncbi:hypothetical protein ANN_00290 [Periplaneta americana]|uniref:Uncharacterized protein n=1 Tax=Periplaneta americana TaxID=6978 RepID=A0ABQ8TRH8_PERAM|nr:hypothetical protein ANN_00290 [Periplaneta americana]